MASKSTFQKAANGEIRAQMQPIVIELGVRIASGLCTREQCRKETEENRGWLLERVKEKVTVKSVGKARSQLFRHHAYAILNKDIWPLLDEVISIYRAEPGVTIEDIKQRVDGQERDKEREKEEEKRDKVAATKARKKAEKKLKAKLQIQREEQDNTKELPPKRKLTPLVTSVKSAGNVGKAEKKYMPCLQFTSDVPALPNKKFPTLPDNCALNSVLAVYIFILSLKSNSFLQLAQSFADAAVEPAKSLVQCIVEGRGTSKEADLLRYKCVAESRTFRKPKSLRTIQKQCGLAGKCRQANVCPKCGKVISQRFIDLAYEVLLVMLGKKDPTYSTTRCTNTNCTYDGDLNTIFCLPYDGFAVAVNGKAQKMKGEDIFREMALDVTAKNGKYECFGAIATLTQADDMDHVVSLFKTNDGIVEACDTNPSQVSKNLKDTEDKDAEFNVEALIYKSNLRCKRT